MEKDKAIQYAQNICATVENKHRIYLTIVANANGLFLQHNRVSIVFIPFTNQ